MFRNHRKKWGAIFTLFVCVGTYNSVVINTESLLAMNEWPFLKRLDEMTGAVEPGRIVATGSPQTTWKKLSPLDVAQTEDQVVLADDTPVAKAPEAAIKEELKLELIEVVNPQKWKKGLAKTEFAGNLATSNGVLDDFSISLPGQDISVSFVEMNGNVFNYDMGGEIYTAMIFQADANSYMVSLTNGPLEGTRMRFMTPPPAEQQVEQQEVAQNLQETHNIEAGTFGDTDLQAQQEATGVPAEPEIPLQAQSFNFDPQIL